MAQFTVNIGVSRHNAPMDTQKQFVTKRMQAHHDGTQGLDKDPLIRAAMDALKPIPPVDPVQRAAFVFSPGWHTKRQAE